MKSILVIGLGLFGEKMARKFSELEQEVMAVDSDEVKVQDILKYVTNAMIGDATNEGFMRTLGVSDYDLCVVTIGDDFQASLETVYLLKQLGAKRVVARASSDVHEKFLLNNGADEVVYPEKQVAEWSAIALANDSIFDYIEIDDSCAIYDIEIPKKWVGHTIANLDIRRQYHLNIIGMRVNGRIVTDVNPNLVMGAGQRLLVAGTVESIQKAFRIK
ncbi:MAG: TrkA family potassium uptake protein [Lachnospiraceae bacterium]|nr:TrkA family potassium uptake protein [Lachnospiraceae bacterium]